MLYARYLDAARRMQQQPIAAPTYNWMTNLGMDPRARNVNDLVTIRVVEAVNATGTADSSLDKNSKAAAAAGNVFGLESVYPELAGPGEHRRGGGRLEVQGRRYHDSRSGALTANDHRARRRGAAQR